VQASVHSFDPAVGSGSVLLDDGQRVPFDGAVFSRSGLRLLRTGQRVTVELSSDAATPTVTSLGIRGVPPR
jgi:2-phospho-L-lactate guanylyltransferase